MSVHYEICITAQLAVNQRVMNLRIGLTQFAMFNMEEIVSLFGFS